MSRSGESGADSSLPPSGRLEGTCVPELLLAASKARLDGSVVFSRDGVQKVVYMRGGQIVFAASRDPEDRLGMLLLRRGQVGLVPLLEAGGEIARGRRMGQILVEHGVMSPDEVGRAVLDQVREIVLSVFDWRRGDWQVTGVALPPDESLTLDVRTEDLILKGVRRMNDWRRVRDAVGGQRAVYEAKPGADASDDSLNLTERAIVEKLAEPQRVDRLCDEIYAPSHDVYRSLWALSILGRVQRAPASACKSRTKPDEGALKDVDGAAALMLDRGDRRFSGVLRLFSERGEGALFLRDGRVVFATTTDSDRSLLAHLLRRGIISDRDHENAVRRLISGKRIGTLLAERGAIEPDEVARFVREQVLEVAKSLSLMTQGEYEVEEGLPSQEEVVLDCSVEEVVMAAFESSDEFLPVWRSLGDVNLLFRLTPDHLARLDRLQLRPSVWELVSLLKEERTLREILSARPEPDFEVCRALNALERVRIVSRVSQDEILMRARQAMRELEAAAASPAESSEDAATDDGTAIDDGAATDDGASSEDGPGEGEATAAEMAPELFGEGEPDELRDDVDAGGEEPAGDGAGEAAGDDDAEAASLADDEFPFAPLEEQDAEDDPDDAYELDDAVETDEAAGTNGPVEERHDEAASHRVPVVFDEVPEPEVIETSSVSPADRDDAHGRDEVVEPLGGTEMTLEERPDFDDGGDPSRETVEESETAGADAVVEPDPASTVKLSREMIESAVSAASPEKADDDDWLDDDPLPDGWEAEAPSVAGTGAGADEPGSAESVEQSGVTQGPEEPALVDETLPPDDAAEPEAGETPGPVDDAELEDTGAVPIDDRCYAAVDLFNRRHAIVFKNLRLEIGAGVKNYVATCCTRLGELGEAFKGAEPDKEGRFDRERLASFVSQIWPDEPERPLDALIEVELDTVRDLLPPRRLAEIEKALEGLGE